MDAEDAQTSSLHYFRKDGKNSMVFEKIKEILSAQFDVDVDTITADTDIVDDLGADSLDLVDMLMSLEDEFNIGEVPDEMIEKIRTVGQLVTYIEENM
jgi:acyl carrier protein